MSQLSKTQLYNIITAPPTVGNVGNFSLGSFPGGVAPATGPVNAIFQNSSFYAEDLKQKVAGGMSTPHHVYEVMNAAARLARNDVFTGNVRRH